MSADVHYITGTEPLLPAPARSLNDLFERETEDWREASLPELKVMMAGSTSAGVV